MDILKGRLTGRTPSSAGDNESQLYPLQPRRDLVEDFAAGYPRFSALLGAHDSFNIYRRFANLRTRVLLLKQDRLSVLEERLETLDREEVAPLFLGSSRLDRNTEREAVLKEIDAALSSYDQSLTREFQILQLKPAKRRDVNSLQNWIAGTACIAREETQYLDHENDLLTLASPEDSTLTGLEDWVEDQLVRFCGKSYKTRCENMSRDANVYISSGSVTTHLARTLLGSLVIVLLLVPILVCNFLESVLPRLIVVMVATAAYIATILSVTQAKTMEVFVTGAAYATVLTVFIVQGGSSTV